MIRDDIPFRLIILAQFVAMGIVRTYFGAPRGEHRDNAGASSRAESRWLSAGLGAVAVLHFSAVLAYLANPGLLRWSAFQAGLPIRWLAIIVSCLGVAGELWAAIALGASYSPLLRVAGEQTVVTAGPYRWIRHPLYAFWVLVMAGWGVGARNWFILASGVALILVLRIARVPREEAMMLAGFGDSYRRYMDETGRFLPRFRHVHEK